MLRSRHGHLLLSGGDDGLKLSADFPPPMYMATIPVRIPQLKAELQVTTDVCLRTFTAEVKPAKANCCKSTVVSTLQKD